MYSVLLHAAGNSQIGVGHLSRTATLASALRKTKAWHRVVLLWESSSELATYFAPDGCEAISVDDRQAALEVRSQLAATGDDWVLTTDLLNLQPQDMLISRTQGFRLLSHLNDSGSGRALADLLVNEDAFKTPAVPIDFAGVGLVGHAYRMIRPSVVQKRPATAWTGSQVKQMLISLGGADPDRLTCQLLTAICPQLPPDLGVTAVIGPAFSPAQSEALQRLAEHHRHLQLLAAPRCLATVLLQHDLIVTLGGLTTYEAFCLGKPCAAIAWSYMSQYVEALQQMRLLTNLGSVQQAPVTLLNWVQDPTHLADLAKRGWQMIDGQGADRVASAVLKLAENRYAR